MSLLAFTSVKGLRVYKEHAQLSFPKRKWSKLSHGRELTSKLPIFRLMERMAEKRATCLTQVEKSKQRKSWRIFSPILWNGHIFHYFLNTKKWVKDHEYWQNMNNLKELNALYMLCYLLYYNNVENKTNRTHMAF